MRRIITALCCFIYMSGTAQVNIFNGGMQDGYGAFLQEATQPAPSIFNGGWQDGMATFTLTATQPAPSIFNGGWQDGYAYKALNATQPAPSIYNGGWQDGYAKFPDAAPTCLPPTALQHLGSTPTTVRIGWTAGSGNIAYNIMLIRQSSTDTFWLSGLITNSLMRDTFECLPTFTNFTYYIRESCGSGSYSPWVGGSSAYTSPGCAAPSAQSNSVVNTQNANLSWTDNTYNSTPYQISYGVGIGNAAQGTKTAVITHSQTGGGTFTHSLYLAGGVGNITWYVREVCGPCDTTAWIGPNTLPATSCNVVATNTMSVTALTTTSATLNWTSTNYNSASKIEVLNVGSSTSVFYNQAANTSYTRSQALSSLTANTAYSWRVKEYCTSGDSTAYSAWQNFTTPASGGGSCAQPTNQGIYVTFGQVMIGKWNSALYGDASKTYQVSYGMNIGSPAQGTVEGNAYFISQTPQFPTHFFATGNNAGFTWFVRDICNVGDTSAWTGPYIMGSSKTDETVFEIQPAHFSIYPNPNKGDVLNVDWSGADEAMLQLHDATGRLLLEAPLLRQPETLTLPQLPQGVYTATLHTAGSVQTRKLIIQP